MKHIDQRIRIRRQSCLSLIWLIAACILLFALASGSHIRSDWSDNQTSSLSPSTLKVLQDLDEPIQIKAYFTADLPQPYGQLQQFIEDKLMAYRDVGQGHIGYEMIDPADDPNIEASLTALNVPKVQVQVIEDDRAQVRQGYLAIIIEYLDQQEIIPVVQTDAGFEYLLTRKIKKISGKGRQRIAVASGFGAKNVSQLETLSQLLEDDYDFMDVDLTHTLLPDDAQVLIVNGLNQAPSEAFRYHLDQFRMSGGSVFVLAANVEPNLSMGFSVLPTDAYAHTWLLSDLGISVEPGLIMDQQASRITVNQQQGGFAFRSVVDFPFIVNVVNINQQHVISQGLETVSMPFAAPLLWVNPSADRHTLLTSSEWSATQSGPPFDVNPLLAMRERFNGLTLRPSAMMLVQEGKMDSAFEQTPAGIVLPQGQQHQKHTQSGRLLIAGSAALLDNEFIEGDNTVLILNMLDWLSHDEALIDLRSLGVSQRPLEPLSQAERSFFKALWVFALPSVLLLLGLWRWWFLRQRRLGSS
ncbi:MAG: GldG family protein [Mariprofundaceae bacterium]|nr:GldG family protein [Mariprofundaceae bacterium]